ncbi:hypothetical protein DICPUDRAFT_156005 [Dictyostelium purpureum]|uniref:Uncharacterized protein n=1 Tax=Dictyostelium purpureum TaxID=5786 RepID=F0ZVG0_DICPU|nr:uncharacterized protein DICPUDRAFT_156005 [Dictyostelium purpureum]EGC32082.1 hypothetical protein DICPUDRAFT_156005 [Dictyostelium purpureum]|eukprot:XP_003291405.1 hypothetical protein DICPUDRAFT_156005 [Dictyostelium purpureum]
MNSFLRTVHIRVKKGIIPPPAGYTALLRVREPFDPEKPKNLEIIESPLLNYAKEFAETHREVGYLSDGRLSQDSYNFAGLKLQYLKKGFSENQADLQAKRDVVKNLEIRSMELDLIQTQATKIGIPSFQPKTHLELIQSLAKKVNNRRIEYLNVEKREILETSLKLKIQYNDISPLQFSQISNFTPIEYFTFIREHPEFQKVLLLPVVEEKKEVSNNNQNSGATNMDFKSVSNSEYDEDYENDEAEENKKNEFAQEVLGGDVNINAVHAGYQVTDYYLVPENLYFNPPAYAGDLIYKPGLNSYVPESSDLIKEELEETEKELYQQVQPDLESDLLGFHERDLDLERYERETDEAKLQEDDFCITLADINSIPEEVERTTLIKNQLRKNFFTKDSLEQSKIGVDSDRFVSKDDSFPSASDFTLNKYSRYPTVSAIKTLRHLFLQDQISNELHQYLERQDGAGVQERVSQDYNIQKNYLSSDLSNIDSMEQLSKYNEIIKGNKSDSKDVEFKELYINTVLGVTDNIYLNPINEQKILKKKYGNDFVFEEEILQRSPEEEKKDILNKISVEDLKSMKGPVFGEDGAIDLQRTNIYSPNQLYESTITDAYKNKYIEQIEKEEKELQDKEIQKETFQEFVSDEIDRVVKGESSIDPVYLLDANNNRVLLNEDDNNNNENNNNELPNVDTTKQPRKKTSFASFYERYILPTDIKEYAEYYKKDIVSNADAARMKAQDLTTNIGKQEERYEEIKELVRDTSDPTDVSVAKEYLVKEMIGINPSLTITEHKWNEHQKLYSEFYKDNSQVELKQDTDNLASAYLSVESSEHRYNAAPSFQDEDKVDFRTLQLDSETETKYAKEIKEFRDKAAKGEITDELSYEFTNYINYLKERDLTTPLVKKVRSKLFFKDHRNEMIDVYNEQLMSSLENDTTAAQEEEEVSDVEKNLKQLGEMIPDEKLREMTINNILSPYYNVDVTSQLSSKLKEIELEKRFSKKN